MLGRQLDRQEARIVSLELWRARIGGAAALICFELGLAGVILRLMGIL